MSIPVGLKRPLKVTVHYDNVQLELTDMTGFENLIVYVDDYDKLKRLEEKGVLAEPTRPFCRT